jgi:molybdopterin molybdotransferase
MRAGQIYNSNRFFLKALLERAGCVVTDMGNIADSLELTKTSLSAAAQDHDLILTSGGVSVGEEDHIKPSVQALGELHQWALSIKPGKPFAYGRINRIAATLSPSSAQSALSDPSYAHFIGLPGNPVSSFVTFMLLVQPFLAYLQGQTQVQYRHIPMRAAFDWPRGDKRREFLRVRQNEDGTLSLYPNQSSGVLTSIVWGDGVVDNPPGTVIKAGDWVQFIPFEGWLR